jgi:predicted MPP superfamily phosphohydrolase
VTDAAAVGRTVSAQRPALVVNCAVLGVDECERDERAARALNVEGPRRLAEAAALDVQLVLSGHTHGGQVIVPAVGPIAGRKFPVLAGYATRDNTALFVSRGVGTVYVPVRINCPPDVAILTLRAATA